MHIDFTLFLTAILSMLGCGLMAGVFFAFSVSVMDGLRRRPAAEGIAAMNAINLAILNPVFLTVFLGTAALCLALVGLALGRWEGIGAGLLAVGGASYLVGGFLVTIFINVPMNNRLAALLPDQPDSAIYWNEYLRRWTAWNHLRAAASLLALGLLIAAL